MPPPSASARLQDAFRSEYPNVQLDDAMLEHLANDLEGDSLPSPESIVGQWSPFLLSLNVCSDDDEALGVCRRLLNRMRESQKTALAEAAAGPDISVKITEPEKQESGAMRAAEEDELNAWLEKVKLVQYREAVFAWCQKVGAAGLPDVLENWQDFAAQLKLKPLEKKRVENAANGRKGGPSVQTPKSPCAPASPSSLPVPAPDPKSRPPASPSSSRREPSGGNFLGPPEDPQKYRILEELGQGATATVYRCQHGEVQRAVKTISLQKLRLQRDFEKIADKLHREVSILFALRHPRIVSLFDVVEEPTKLHLVMELVEGGPEGVELFDYIVARGSFSEPISRYVFLQIVEGLQYIHSKDIVYRDLKPENILVDEKASKREEGLFEVKLSDFGHSKMIKDGYSTALTRVGTPQYWAPEVSDPRKCGPDGYGTSVDLWSLGVVLYVMLIGSYPFDGVGESIDDQIRKGHISNFRSQSTNREASLPAQDLIRSLVQVDPRMRRSLEACRTHPWASVKGGPLDQVMRPWDDPHVREERITLPVKPSKDARDALNRDLHKWMKKFKCSVRVRETDVIANLDDQALTEGHSIEDARNELHQLVHYHFGSTATPPQRRHGFSTLAPVPEKRTFRIITLTLRVHNEHGAGLELEPERGGMRIQNVEPLPGQPGLQAQDLITKINEVSLRGTPETVEGIFGRQFRDGVEIAIRREM